MPVTLLPNGGFDRFWSKQVIDLAAYAGQQVTIRFAIAQEAQPDPDDPGWGSWSLDDVGFQAVP